MFLGCSLSNWSSRLLQLLLCGSVDGAISGHRHSNYYIWVLTDCSRRLDSSLVISWQGAWIQCFGYGRFASFIRFLILLVVEFPVFAFLAPDVPSFFIVFAIIFITFRLFLFLRRVLGGSSFYFDRGDIIFSTCLGDCGWCLGISLRFCPRSISGFFIWAVRLWARLILLFIIILAFLILLIPHHGLLVVSLIGQVCCKGLNCGILWDHSH